MPIPGTYAPPADADALDQASAALPLDQGLRFRTIARSAQNIGAAVGHAFGEDFAGVIPGGPQIEDVTQPLATEELNERFGVEGYLRFNQPTTAYDAAFRQSEAQQRKFRDYVLANTRASPLSDLGAGLFGALTDPAGAALMFATDGLAEPVLGAVGLGRGAAAAGDAASVLSKLGRVANFARVPVEGAVNQVPYVAVNAAATNYVGDDYGAGDALRDIAAGAIFHTTLHGVNLAVRGLLGRTGAPDRADYAAAGVEPPQPFAPSSPDELVPPAGVPGEVAALPPEARLGALAKALDDMAADRPVEVGDLVARELEPPALARLDEASAEPRLASFRPLGEDTAITTRGTLVPVRYGLAELADLETSHDDGLQPNPAFPQELQPRDRARAGAQARNHQLEAQLNPRLLMSDVSAAAGAPIIAPDGTVESGNGRTIALRRSAGAGGDAYRRYLAELKAQGFDTAGMRQPVLVRMRTQPMTGGERAALAREMNADVTERMSGAEQAMADALRMDDALLELGDRTQLTDRDFARSFIDRVAPEQVGTLVDREGRLSPEGERRIRAAVLARAYGDPRLVAQVFEGEESAGRQLAEGLAEAAPTWARLRALAAKGEVPRELDLTAAINSAMDLVRYAREEGVPLGELVAERLGQADMFTGEAISPWTEAFLRLFHRDAALAKPMAPAKIAAALKDYARQAMKVTPGENLFGETADESTARAIFDNAAERFRRGDAGALDVRPPGRAAGAEPKPVVIDLRDAGGEGAGPGERGVPAQGGPGAEGEGGGAGPARPGAEQLIAADPELKALHEATEALIAENGLELKTPDNQDPHTVAEAIRAAAVCLAEEGT